MTTANTPNRAVLAYQRAAQVMDAVDSRCRLDWSLLAAIGHVESDHGRFGDNRLDRRGVATPGIRGVPLDGREGTRRIRDTDAGRYDDDTRWDRAVGPMQFIPSTWAVVGVDGDADGQRNPQDVDDAALASGVYLCAGDGNLARTDQRREAVLRYNHSEKYADLVLRLARAYAEAGPGTPVTDVSIDVEQVRTVATSPDTERHSTDLAQGRRRADRGDADRRDRGSTKDASGDGEGHRSDGGSRDGKADHPGGHERDDAGTHQGGAKKVDDSGPGPGDRNGAGTHPAKDEKAEPTADPATDGGKADKGSEHPEEASGNGSEEAIRTECDPADPADPDDGTDGTDGTDSDDGTAIPGTDPASGTCPGTEPESCPVAGDSDDLEPDDEKDGDDGDDGCTTLD